MNKKACTDFYTALQNCAKLYKTIHNCTQLYNTLRAFTKLFKTVQTCTQLHTTLNIFRTLYTIIQNMTNHYQTLQTNQQIVLQHFCKTFFFETIINFVFTKQFYKIVQNSSNCKKYSKFLQNCIKLYNTLHNFYKALHNFTRLLQHKLEKTLQHSTKL